MQKTSRMFLYFAPLAFLIAIAGTNANAQAIGGICPSTLVTIANQVTVASVASSNTEPHAQVPAQSATVLNQIHYILDHKEGISHTASEEDVQWAIWAVQGKKTEGDLTSSGHIAADELYLAAIGNTN